MRCYHANISTSGKASWNTCRKYVERAPRQVPYIHTQGNWSVQLLIVKVEIRDTRVPVLCREVHNVDVSWTLAALDGSADNYVLFAVGRGDTGVSKAKRNHIFRCQFLARISDCLNVFKRACISLYQEHWSEAVCGYPLSLGRRVKRKNDFCSDSQIRWRPKQRAGSVAWNAEASI